MKTVTLLGLFACAIAVFLGSCGKSNDASNPTSTNTTVGYDSDVAAVQAILTANSITTYSASDLTYFLKTNVNGAYRITEIWFKNKGVTIIPSQIGQLTALKYLTLDSNSITSLPPEIGNCTKLENVSLSNNKIATIPAQMGNCVALVSCDLRHNNLTSLPDGFYNCVAIQSLFLDFNSLDSLSSGVSKLTQLNRLQLANNQLTKLPTSITALVLTNGITVENNNLCPATLPQAVSDWISRLYDNIPWKTTQTCP